MRSHELFKGLGDPTRLRIFVLLLEQELCVCDLMAVLGQPQSTVSRHMARLKSAGLVSDRRKGKWVYYRLESGPMISELRKLLRRNLEHSEPHAGDLSVLQKYVSAGHCDKKP